MLRPVVRPTPRPTPTPTPTPNPNLKALRSLRLGKYSKSFRLLLATLKFGFPALCNIVLLLYIVLYVFAMLGMVLFGGMTVADEATASSGISKHANFNSVAMSMQTVRKPTPTLRPSPTPQPNPPRPD